MGYRVEFDVKLWTYVLRYRGNTYPLDVDNAPEADTRAQLKLNYLKRQENGSDGNITI